MRREHSCSRSGEGGVQLVNSVAGDRQAASTEWRVCCDDKEEKRPRRQHRPLQPEAWQVNQWHGCLLFVSPTKKDERTTKNKNTNRAEKLIHGLGGERARWGDMATMLKGWMIYKYKYKWGHCKPTERWKTQIRILLNVNCVKVVWWTSPATSSLPPGWSPTWGPSMQDTGKPWSLTGRWSWLRWWRCRRRKTTMIVVM